MAQDKITGELVSSVFLTLFNLQLLLTIRTIKQRKKEKNVVQL